jgi:hypothetical protein
MRLSTGLDQVNSLSIDRISQVGWLETRTQVCRKGLIVEVVEQSYERSGGLKNSSPSDSTQDGDDDLYNFLSLDMSPQDLTLYFFSQTRQDQCLRGAEGRGP